MYIQYKIPDEELFIIGFFPLINLTTTHHLLTFTCSIPYSNESSSTRHQPCISSAVILYEWSHSKPTLSLLLKGVGFAVGRRVNSLYRVRNGNVTLIIKDSPQIYQAFTSLLLRIDIKSGDYLIGQCVYDNNDDRVIVTGTTRNDEMCKIYVMYAYIPTSNQETIDQQSPFPVCWDNQVSSMIDLIPTDSRLSPPISKDHQNRMHGSKSSSTNLLYNGESLMIDDTEMFASPDSLKLATTKRFSFNHEIFVVLWIILVTILILCFMICCITHICLNKNALDVNNNDTTIVSIFANWINPEKKLIRLESDVDKDDSSSSLIANDDTIIKMESKLTTIIINDKNSAVIF
ncbi:unnamed protein product [Adineta steineri]|uniref:Copper type II ascorbate-dependent monooxygenase C-terminal domain-containing protein n=1 Tax=Adineta steineri TaxID=433720 RepID=A0A815A368_9BILA|nr:unnamed protein product [Adineta steineri]CAF1251698.1 unnamed protein product [Adineta steineri]